MKESRTKKAKRKSIPIAALSAAMILTSSQGFVYAESTGTAQEETVQDGQDGSTVDDPNVTTQAPQESSLPGTPSNIAPNSQLSSNDPENSPEAQKSRFYTSTYVSEHMDQKEMSYRVYLPEGYYESSRNYPVVYLLHGENNSSESFEKSGIADKLDQWMKAGTLQKMIVVMPDSSGGSYFVNQTEGDDKGNWEEMIVNDLVPAVDGKFRTIAKPQYRGITGISMGGFGAFVIGLDHPELFGSIGSHRAPLGMTVANYNPMTLLKSKTDSQLKAYSIYLDGGTDDPYTYADNSTNDIHAYLRSKSISHGYQMRPGDHAPADALADLNRSFGAFSSKFAKGILTGSFTATPQALSIGTEEVSVSYTTRLDRAAAELFQNGNEDEDFKLSVSLKVTDPEGNVLYTEVKNAGDVIAGSGDSEFTGSFNIPVEQLGASKSTTVSLEASLLGSTVSLGSKPLIRVTPTGTLPEDIQIDLLGDWKFKKDSQSQPSLHGEADNVDTTDWATVQPGLDWWTDGFGGYSGLNNYYGAAWYQRTFFVPEDFPDQDLTLMAGKIDDADITYINGVKVGETGFENGVYKSSFWAASRQYKIPSNLLKRGQVNTIAVYMVNDNGGGGWYSGPIGIYTKAAMQKIKNLPSEVPSQNIVTAVKELAAKQYQAVDQKDLSAYADTLSAQYFEKGIDKLKLLDQRRQWSKDYATIKTTIDNPYVFTLNNRYLYTAEVKITGTTADGTETVLQQGAVSQYYQQESGKLRETGDQKLFFVTQFYSESAKRTVKYRVYLPQSYLTHPDKRYPSVYLLHQFNSDSESYEIDKIDQILNREIAAGRSKDMIVVMPDSSGLSWWVNGAGPDGVKWQDMVVKDLVPHVDQKYRTIDDARYRGTSGVSMGGFGSFVIGFQYPDLFSSAVSHMGALSFTQAGQNPVSIIKSYPIEALKRYSIYFDSGNEDVYKFDVPVATLHKYLNDNGVDHYAEIRDGLHDSAFYTKSVDLSFAQHSRHFADAHVADGILAGSLNIRNEAGNKAALYQVTTKEGLNAYLDNIPASPYVKNQTPDLHIPITLELTNQATGERLVAQQDELATRSGSVSKDGTLAIPVLADGNYSIKLKASVLDRTFTLAAADYTVGGSTGGSSGNTGGGSAGGSNSGTPVVTPGGDGTAGTSNGAGGFTITGEAAAAALQKQTDLQIQLSSGISLVLPYDALNQITTELGQGFKLLNWTAAPVTAADQKSMTQSAGQRMGGQLKPAGSFINLEMTATLADGSIRKLNPAFRQPVKIQLAADSGTDQQLAGVYYWNAKGEAEFTRSKWNSKTRTFEAQVDHFGTYSLLTFTKPFNDVQSSSWYNRAVEVMVAQHIVTGVNDTRFAPSHPVTRAEFAALVTRMLGLEESSSASFADVSKDSWYASSVSAAYQAGIIKGVSADAFEPNRQITREQMAVMTYNALQKLNPGENGTGNDPLAGFTDAKNINAWAKQQMAALVQLGLIQGKNSSSIAPQGAATRAEAVQVLYNLLQHQSK
ncbi:alpha/beta hydrolase-fold protein [Paenibacillus sp. JX-17]|uniref:Alpha/beta hydrolase-fold protein n=1 Tax=Paenibacillus lacisoli TaxID=3064525 RepID=A0ABT9C8W7_9BACL|nr:alpha/beta hydrolase-fold protein [Paenibacillus sp. JX-17]MDO7905706.1 alpha/beta hydrolase-fold protein [Paenibacillus sp. JX-17]